MTEQHIRYQKWTYLIVLTLLMWEMLPEHKKRMTLMRIADAGKRKSQHIAAYMGRQGLHSEMRGEKTAAEMMYRTAYKIMTGAHRFWERQYEIHRG